MGIVCAVGKLGELALGGDATPLLGMEAAAWCDCDRVIGRFGAGPCPFSPSPEEYPAKSGALERFSVPLSVCAVDTPGDDTSFAPTSFPPSSIFFFPSFRNLTSFSISFIIVRMSLCAS